LSPAVRGLKAFQDFIQETLLRQGPVDSKTPVDQGLGNGADAIVVRQVGKLRGLDGVRADMVILDGELIGEAHGPWTVWSGGSDEDFQVEGAAQLCQLVSACGQETGIPLRYRKNSIE